MQLSWCVLWNIYYDCSMWRWFYPQ